MNLDEIKGWAKDSGNIAIYLFGHEGDKHKLEVVDSGSGDVFYKSVHDTREDAVGRMCEIKGLDVPDPDAPKMQWGQGAQQKKKGLKNGVIKSWNCL